MNSLWIDFVNSDCRDPLGRGEAVDRLESPKWLHAFSDEWRLDRIEADSPRRLTKLREMRSLLHECVGVLVDERRALTTEQIDTLNGYLAAPPVTSRLEPDDDNKLRVSLRPTKRGIEAVLFAIAMSFAEFLIEGDAARLKSCENQDCRWVFYDQTRSRTRRWCADSCGNLIKVRRFRARSKQAQGQPSAMSRQRPKGKGEDR